MRAPAKVNWTLEVLGRRADGYHEIASVMSTISLSDLVALTPADEWRLTVHAPEPLAQALETSSNLVMQAAAEFAWSLSQKWDANVARTAEFPPPEMFPEPPSRWRMRAGTPVHFHVVKRIPVGAGLGGGSSDAARAIRLLLLHWDLDPLFRIQSSRDRAWLTRVMARVGSDVPFFLHGGTQLVTGRGDTLRPLGDLRSTWVVVLTPPLSTDGKTARMYTLLSARHYTDGSRSVGLAEDLDGSPPRRIEESDIYNVFDEVAPMAFPEIGWYRERLGGATGRPVHLCGAGPSLFALCPGAAAAHQAARALRAEGHTAWAMQVIARETVRR